MTKAQKHTTAHMQQLTLYNEDYNNARLLIVDILFAVFVCVSQ